MIVLPDLPYTVDALEPVISAQTVEIHYGKHHRAYVDKTNALADELGLAKLSLEEVVRRTARQDASPTTQLHNNAAQVWNHTFYWRSMRYRGGGAPRGPVKQLIERTFNSFEGFASAFMGAATQHFGSGWAWLTLVGERAEIVTTSNADTPLASGGCPLLVLDLWEHAYYLDHQNRRADYVAGFLNSLASWDFANANLDRAHRQAAE